MNKKENNIEMGIDVFQQFIFDCACDLEYNTRPIEQIIAKLYELSEVKIRKEK